jgi:hypothetical protein
VTQCPDPNAADKSIILVTCKYGSNAIKDKQGNVLECECGFKDVIAQIKKLINFAFLIALPIVIIALTYAGIKILLSLGNPSALTEAKRLLWQVIKGFLIILCAWLIVYVIVSNLLQESFYNMFLGG